MSCLHPPTLGCPKCGAVKNNLNAICQTPQENELEDCLRRMKDGVLEDKDSGPIPCDSCLSYYHPRPLSSGPYREPAVSFDETPQSGAYIATPGDLRFCVMGAGVSLEQWSAYCQGLIAAAQERIAVATEAQAQAIQQWVLLQAAQVAQPQEASATASCKKCLKQKRYCVCKNGG